MPTPTATPEVEWRPDSDLPTTRMLLVSRQSPSSARASSTHPRHLLTSANPLDFPPAGLHGAPYLCLPSAGSSHDMNEKLLVSEPKASRDLVRHPSSFTSMSLFLDVLIILLKSWSIETFDTKQESEDGHTSHAEIRSDRRPNFEPHSKATVIEGDIDRQENEALVSTTRFAHSWREWMLLLILHSIVS
jgi:hypothetical protein